MQIRKVVSAPRDHFVYIFKQTESVVVQVKLEIIRIAINILN